MSVPLIALLCSFTLTFFVKLITEKTSLLDIPNERSSHTVPTPRGGGIAIAITWFIGISYFYIECIIEENLYFALMSGILISIISFIDDIYDLSPLPRILIQSIAALIALYFIGGFQQLDLGFFIIKAPYILSSIAFIGILWFINLFNFLDGIDGYAACESIFISLALYIFIRDEVLLILALSILGFLPWNWDKAKIFMGDIGSTLLGFTVCILAIYYNNTGEFNFINSLILSGVFWFDATYTLFKRYRNKEKLSTAHKKHAYQRIVQYGYSHQKTVILAILTNLILITIVIIVGRNTEYLLIAFFVSCALLLTIYKLVGKKFPFQ